MVGMPIPPGGLYAADDDDVPARAPVAMLAPRINPLTGDFESLFRGRPLADAFAIEAIRVQRGTGAAVRGLGNRYREITHVEDDSPEIIESMTFEAFEAAEAAGVARLVSVTAQVDDGDPSQLSTVIEYRDLLAPQGAPTRRLVFSS